MAQAPQILLLPLRPVDSNGSNDKRRTPKGTRRLPFHSGGGI